LASRKLGICVTLLARLFPVEEGVAEAALVDDDGVASAVGATNWKTFPPPLTS